MPYAWQFAVPKSCYLFCRADVPDLYAAFGRCIVFPLTDTFRAWLNDRVARWRGPDGESRYEDVDTVAVPVKWRAPGRIAEFTKRTPLSRYMNARDRTHYIAQTAQIILPLFTEIHTKTGAEQLCMSCDRYLQYMRGDCTPGVPECYEHIHIPTNEAP